MNSNIRNGDVYNIGQTVNGVFSFLWINDKWYYFTERLSREYEYDQEDLTATIKDINEVENVRFVKNIFD
tara:strand:+ start:54 stop:263 length:210 start_codon:yes stop_codon:yes gene_type:complete